MVMVMVMVMVVVIVFRGGWMIAKEKMRRDGRCKPKKQKAEINLGPRVSERRWDGRYDVLTLVCLVLASGAGAGAVQFVWCGEWKKFEV